MSRNLLLLAYFFPPFGGAGSQRPAKFCKHLPSLGYRTTVLTRPDNAAPRFFDRVDESLVFDVDGVSEVVQVAPAASAREGWVDRMAAWSEAAAEEAVRLAHENRFDAVLLTMSPFSLALAGRRIQRETGLPVVYDLRDPWALDGWPSYRHRWEWRRHHRLMVETLESADGVIANTPDALGALLEAAPGLDAARVVDIPNGFDEADFAGEAPGRRHAPDEFVIVHTGTFMSHELYPPGGLAARAKGLLRHRPEPIRPEGRTPKFLLRAVASLREEGHPLGRLVRLVFVGQDSGATARCVEESGVGDAVELLGYVPHSESVAWLRRADALFLPLHGLPAGKRSLIVPGKTYEYLASGRPILGALPEGDARDLVERSGRGFCAEPCDDGSVKAALVRMWEAVRSGAVPAEREAWVEAYERRALTRRLASFLEERVLTRAPQGSAA